jgi:hypothetical protein
MDFSIPTNMNIALKENQHNARKSIVNAYRFWSQAPSSRAGQGRQLELNRRSIHGLDCQGFERMNRAVLMFITMINTLNIRSENPY